MPRNDLNERFNARLDKDTVTALKELARKTRLNMSELFRRMVAKAKPQDFADES